MRGPLPVTPDDVRAAATRIEPYVHRTPVLTSRTLDERLGARVFFKCENLQRIGAFKMRGATNAIAQLSEAERRRGVVTHSSGNHAQAVALAARSLGTHATIVMPENAPRVKREATEGYGAKVVSCRPTQADREAATAAIVDRDGAILIHPYEHPDVVAGQGTAALELLEDAYPLDRILTPAGGGGILAGTTVVASEHPGTDVIGCEPEGADDAFRSLRDGVRVRSQRPDTICDGLRTLLGDLPFRILEAEGTGVVTVSDDEVREAMRFVYERMKLVIEPSSAVPVAALLHERVAVEGLRVGVIVTGGNVDLRDWIRHLGG